MKNKPLFLGLSTVGLAFAMQSNAMNVIDLTTEASSNINISAPSSNTLWGKSNKTRKIIHDNNAYDANVITEQKDQLGKTHTKLEQTYNGIPIYGRQITAHTSKNKGLARNSLKYTGQIVDQLENDLAGAKPADGFTEQEALQFAKNLHNQNKSLSTTELVYENESSKLFIYTNDENGRARLVYKVSFFVDDTNGNMPARPNYIIDAATKEVIKSWNGLMHNRVGVGPGGNEKIGKYEYGKDMPKLDLRATSRGECFMTNSKVRTVDLKNGYFGAKTFHFACFNNDNDAVNGAYSPLNDAHYFGEQVFNMYREWYEKDPLTFKLIMRVHYGTGYENAFWNGSSMTFGDGRSYFYPLVSMDVVGHEVSHGFTEQNSNLEYMGQSGGINESFSDMAGKATEYFTFGDNTWGIGDDITKGKEPLRFMDDPTKDKFSIDDARNYDEWLDVHATSGVFNKAFYILATSSGWNIKKAFDVFVHANTYYWTQNTDYKDGALGAIYSSEDLGYNLQDVVAAFKQVGIECTEESCKIMAKAPTPKPEEPKPEEPKPEPSPYEDSDWESDYEDEIV